jgi:hypothetical protein
MLLSIYQKILQPSTAFLLERQNAREGEGVPRGTPYGKGNSSRHGCTTKNLVGLKQQLLTITTQKSLKMTTLSLIVKKALGVLCQLQRLDSTCAFTRFICRLVDKT